MSLSRRGFLAATTLGAGAGALGEAAAQAEPALVVPGESSYESLTRRGHNRRFIARPDRIYIPSSVKS